jgi:polysaccharide deacetylase family protein (PEP-CTERM system associated)
MLGMLDEQGARATFFVLGWVAERCPALIQRIGAGGHEVASHGYGHDLLTDLTADEFRAAVTRSKTLLEDLTGRAVRGYRAPSFSITDWAIPILRDLGFDYDSSAFPTVAHDRYGRLPGVAAGQPTVALAPDFHEVCISCLALGSRGLPWGGGGYFRLLPYEVFRRGVARIQATAPPYVFYIHPWELDVGQPRLGGLKRSERFRHYLNIEKTETRWLSLMRDFEWTTISQLLAGAHRLRSESTASTRTEHPQGRPAPC